MIQLKNIQELSKSNPGILELVTVGIISICVLIIFTAILINFIEGRGF